MFLLYLKLFAVPSIKIFHLDDKENFHEILMSATNAFTQNMHGTKGSTCNLLNSLQRSKGIVLLSGDKDSSVLILYKACYKEKNRLINDGISKGVYVIEENDNTAELKLFQNFIYRNFKKHEKYNKMGPASGSQLDFSLQQRHTNLQISSK